MANKNVSLTEQEVVVVLDALDTKKRSLNVTQARSQSPRLAAAISADLDELEKLSSRLKAS